MKKGCVLLLMVSFLISCSNDSNSGTTADPQMSGIAVRTKTVFDDASMPLMENVAVTNFQNGKPFSETVENFENGVSTGAPVTTQNYFYNGNLLVSQIDNQGNPRHRDFYYDAADRIVGAKMTLQGSDVNYYRFVYVSDNVVYFERLSLPYNDPAATVLFRNIIEFDANNNIVRAGNDTNMDGVAENQNQFSYVDNNLVSIVRFNGSVQNFNYSNVIDNFSVLYDEIYGKRNLRLIQSEDYVGPGGLAKFQSANIVSQELVNNDYQVLSSNFYKKRTVIRNVATPAAQQTTTTEFFFE